MSYFKRKKHESEGLNWYFAFECILCGVIVLTIILDLPDFTSAAFYLSFVVEILHFGKLIMHGITKTKVFCFFLMVLTMVALCISTMAYNEELSFEYIKEYLLFMSTIIYLCIAAEEKLNQRTTFFILKANLLISFIYPIAYFTIPDITSNIGLHLHFTNTNLTGMWLLQSVLFCFVGFMSLKGAWRALSLVTGMFNVYLVILTNARNSYLALALFIALFAWNLLKLKPRYSKTFVVIMLLLPLIFIPLYFWLVEPVTENGWLDFLVSDGKNLDSRLRIWNRALRYLNAGYSWLYGNYPYLRGNMHNAYMVVLGSYGIIVLGAVIAYLVHIVSRVNENIRSKFGRYCLSGFLAGMFLGIGEGAYFSGGVGLNLVITLFLFLARHDLDTSQVRRLKDTAKNKSRYIK